MNNFWSNKRILITGGAGFIGTHLANRLNAKGSKVQIGDNCDIASFVSINVADSHLKVLGKSKKIKKNKILIGKNVFIGSHSVILGGSEIGNYSVIGAGTIVRGEKIPPYSLAIGNPLIIKQGYYKKNK